MRYTPFHLSSGFHYGLLWKHTNAQKGTRVDVGYKKGGLFSNQPKASQGRSELGSLDDVTAMPGKEFGNQRAFSQCQEGASGLRPQHHKFSPAAAAQPEGAALGPAGATTCHVNSPSLSPLEPFVAAPNLLCSMVTGKGCLHGTCHASCSATHPQLWYCPMPGGGKCPSPQE